VGTETSDDAAVVRVGDGRVLVQTVDFFTPILDDPYLFGAIAAANSVSDVYAMGAEPLVGLAIAGFPTDKLPLDVLELIFAGGAAKAAEAGFPIAGGHTIIDDVPKYGLVVTGTCAESDVVLNSTAKAGDLLYLTKPVGNGIVVCAYRAGVASRLKGREPGVDVQMDEAVRWMLTLNKDASRAMVKAGASACTDVTGYGLLGHLREMCAGSGTGARIVASAVPVLDGARELAENGYVPGGSRRNEKSMRPLVRLSAGERDFTILCDAQTSGGLLIAIPPDKADALERELAAAGVPVHRIGAMTGEPGVIEVTNNDVDRG
jgi:selenide, water dikinase